MKIRLHNATYPSLFIFLYFLHIYIYKYIYQCNEFFIVYLWSSIRLGIACCTFQSYTVNGLWYNVQEGFIRSFISLIQAYFLANRSAGHDTCEGPIVDHLLPDVNTLLQWHISPYSLIYDIS